MNNSKLATPFTICLRGKIPSVLNPENTYANVTLNHTILDLKKLIWSRSLNHELVPESIEIIYKYSSYIDDEKFIDVLGTFEPPSETIHMDVNIIREAAIPRPFQNETFAVELSFPDAEIVSHESLSSSIYEIKSAISQLESKENERFKDIKDFQLSYNGTVLGSNDVTLREILGIDVIPLHEIIVTVESLIENPTPNPLHKRFLIKLSTQAEIPHKLIEVTLSQKISNIKQKLIESMDEFSVARTFMDQVKLIYQGRLLQNDDNLSQALQITVPPQEIIILHMVVSPFSNDNSGFWRDIRRSNRFEVLPRVHNNGVEEDLTEQPTTTMAPPSSLPEPTRTTPMVDDGIPMIPLTIRMGNGESLVLSGESHDTVTQNNQPVFVNQNDLSSIRYVVTVDTPEGPKECTLSTSQCIINDTPGHEPYLLLSPSGMSKLYNMGAQINQVQVIISENNTNAPQSNSANNLGNQSNHMREDRARTMMNEYMDNNLGTNGHRNGIPNVPNRGANGENMNLTMLTEQLIAFFRNDRFNRFINFSFVLGRVVFVLYFLEFQKLVSGRPIMTALLFISILLLNFTRRDFINNLQDILRNDLGLLGDNNDVMSAMLRNINNRANNLNNFLSGLNDNIINYLLFDNEGNRMHRLGWATLQSIGLFFVTLVPAWQIKLDTELSIREANEEMVATVAQLRAFQEEHADVQPGLPNGQENEQNDDSEAPLVEIQRGNDDNEIDMDDREEQFFDDIQAEIPEEVVYIDSATAAQSRGMNLSQRNVGASARASGTQNGPSSNNDRAEVSDTESDESFINDAGAATGLRRFDN